MTEPLYAINQYVGVCTPFLTVVIPETQVTERKFSRKATGKISGKVFRDIWVYKVRGHSGWLSEWSLRPINPTSEYLESPSHLEVPA